MVQACGVVAKGRGDALLVATMLSMFIFDRIEGADGRARGVPLLGGKAGLVFSLVVARIKALITPAAGVAPGRLSSVPLMGGASGLGLGLALAQPARRVIVMDGDASLLMELGSLITVAGQRPANLLHVLVNNGTQFTGLANAATLAADLNWTQLARHVGYAHAECIEDGVHWAKRFPALLTLSGPVFVELRVQPVPRQARAGFEQQEMPDQQFERMAREAGALQGMLDRQAGPHS